MIGPGDDASVHWLAEIDAGRVTGIVQRIVRGPSFQTERFEADPEVQRFIGETVGRETTALGLPWQRDSMGNLVSVADVVTCARALAHATVRHLTHPRPS